jgi:hypothetical protein
MRLDDRGRRAAFISKLELRSDEMLLEELRGSETRKVAFQLLAGLPTWLSRQRRQERR